MPATGPVTVDSPLGPDALVFLAMRGREALGRPFEYVVDLVADDPNITLGDLLGQTLAVHLELGDGSFRHFHGFITGVDFVRSTRFSSGAFNASDSINTVFSGPGAVQAVGTFGVGVNYRITSNFSMGLEAIVHTSPSSGPFAPWP